MKRTPAQANTDDVVKRLRAFGLAYPGAHTKSPWPGHMDLAVKDKTFAYLSVEGEPFAISCKLPRSAELALQLPFAKPTAYGLGRAGWVTARFAPGDAPPVDLLEEWIDESYRAQAPKKLVAALGADQRQDVRRKPKAEPGTGRRQRAAVRTPRRAASQRKKARPKS